MTVKNRYWVICLQPRLVETLLMGEDIPLGLSLFFEGDGDVAYKFSDPHDAHHILTDYSDCKLIPEYEYVLAVLRLAQIERRQNSVRHATESTGYWWNEWVDLTLD